MRILESIMLICFGLAWPVNIYKSWTTRSTVGKSLFFLVIIAIGYISGTINKYLYNPDIVMYLYLLNLPMVLMDIAIYFRNRWLDKKQIEVAVE